LGIGDWGLGGWGVGPKPHPQKPKTPTPKPKTTNKVKKNILNFIFKIKNFIYYNRK